MDSNKRLNHLGEMIFPFHYKEFKISFFSPLQFPYQNLSSHSRRISGILIISHLPESLTYKVNKRKNIIEIKLALVKYYESNTISFYLDHHENTLIPSIVKPFRIHRIHGLSELFSLSNCSKMPLENFSFSWKRRFNAQCSPCENYSPRVLDFGVNGNPHD